MKLIIQIPCLNEEETLPATLADLPREVDGFDTVEWLIIDDGSTDRTVEVAREHGVDHVVRLTKNKGLAVGFQAGLDACLKLGADVIVNTDADNQYYGGDIQKLVLPIVEGRADMVVGDRQTDSIEHFSPLKKRLQKLGSSVVRQASDTGVTDTTSGFRAYNREAAIQMAVVSKFTYTLETIIQAGKLLVATENVPIRTNPTTRESRLFPSMGAYVRRNTVSIARIYAQYEPLRVFMTLAAVLFALALIPWIRFLVASIQGDGAGHVQSLILGAVLFNASVVMAALGVLGELLYGQRIMIQRVFERVRRIELQLEIPPSHYEPGPARPGRAPGDDRRPRRSHPRGAAPVHAGAGGGPAVSTNVTVDREGTVTGNTFDKYGSTNPVVRRLMTRLPREPRRALATGRAALDPRRRLRRGRAHARVGAEARRRAHRRHRPRRPAAARAVGDAHRAEPRVPRDEGREPAVRRRRVRHGDRDRGPRARARPGRDGRRDGALRAALAARLGPARAGLARRSTWPAAPTGRTWATRPAT